MKLYEKLWKIRWKTDHVSKVFAEIIKVTTSSITH